MHKKKEHVTCSRGHEYYKSEDFPVCPICWPGRYKSKKTRVPYEKRHQDGTLWAKGFLKEGKMDGNWEWFRKDGTVMRSGFFTMGKQSGIWRTYRKDKTVVKETNFEK